MIAIEDKLGGFYAGLERLIGEAQKTDNFPSTVYHYTSVDGLNGILDTNSIWFTRRDFLNDPTEYLYIHEVIDDCLSILADKPDYVKLIKHINQYTQKLKLTGNFLSIDRELYTASFSTDADSWYMWKEYTKSSKCDGYNIGFNSSLIKKVNEDLCIASVIYDLVRQREIIGDFLHFLARIWEFHKAIETPKEDIEDKLKWALIEYTSEVGPLFKSPSYMREKEVRIIIRASKENVKFRTAGGILIPYVPIKFGKELIQSITISPTLECEFAKNGVRAALEKYKIKAKVLYSKLSFS